LADVVGAGDRALRSASVEASAGLFLLVRSENRLAVEFDAVGLGVGLAARGAFENAAPFEFRCHTEDGEDDVGKIGCRIKERLG